MANTKIPSELVAINAISGTLIADNAITSVHIAQNNITATQIAINAVTATQIADGTITSAKIADGTIVTADIADGQITTAKLVDSSVTTAKIAAGTILGGDIANNAILTQHIDDNQITADQIADNAVGLDQMAGLTRGSIIYGNAAGNPAYLAAGTSGHVLTSDGTDISWTADTDLFLATTGGTITGDLTISEATPTLKFTDTDNNYDATIAGLSGSLVLTADSGAEFGTETIQLHTGGSSTLTLDASQNATFAGDIYTANNISSGFASTLKGYFYESTVDQNGTGKPSSVLGLAANINSRGEGPSIDFNAIWAAAAGYQQDNWNEGWTVSRIAGIYDSAGLDTGALAFYTQTSGSSGGASSSSLTEKMRLNSSGNVGIGTASPGRKLDVSSGGSDVPQIRASYNATNYLDLKHNLINAVSSGGNDSLHLQTAGTTGLTIDVNRKVGIGTDSPLAKLNVKGTQGQWRIDPDSVSSEVQALITNTANSGFVDYRLRTNQFIVDTSGAERMRIDSSGLVGIGNDDAGSMSANANKLVVGTGSGNQGMSVFAGTSVGRYAFARAVGDNTDAYDGGMAYDGSRNLTFHTNANATRMTIDGSGDVGIGTSPVKNSSYSTVLHVHGNASGASVRVTEANTGTGATAGLELLQYNTDSFFLNRSNGAAVFFTNNAERMRIDSVGTMILQADGASNLGRIQFSSQAATYQILGGNNIGYLGYKTGGYHRFFGSDGLEDMRIDSSGRLLIGTTSTTPGFGNVNGHAFHIGDASHISRDAGTALIVNRGTNDGDIIDLRRAGTQVGTISAVEGPAGSRGLKVTSSATLELKTQEQHVSSSVSLGGASGSTVGLGQFANNGRGWWIRVTANSHYSSQVSSQVWEFTQNAYVGENHNTWLQVPETVSSSYHAGDNHIALDVYRDNVAGSTSTPIHLRFRSKGKTTATGDVYYTIESLNGMPWSHDGRSVAGTTSGTWANTSTANMNGAVGGYYPTRSKYEFPVSSGAFWTDNAVINADGAKGLYISNKGTVGIGFDKHMHTNSNVGMAGSYDHAGTLHLAGDDSIFVQTSTYGSNSEFMHYVYNDYYKIFRNTGGSNQTALHINSSLTVSGVLNNTSDRNLKKNITSLPTGSLEVIGKLNPVNFDWKVEERGSNAGFIAQELQEVLPNEVSGDAYNDSEDLHEKGEGLSINTTGIVAHLVKAIQELEKRVKELEG